MPAAQTKKRGGGGGRAGALSGYVVALSAHRSMEEGEERKGECVVKDSANKQAKVLRNWWILINQTAALTGWYFSCSFSGGRTYTHHTHSVRRLTWRKKASSPTFSFFLSFIVHMLATESPQCLSSARGGHRSAQCLNRVLHLLQWYSLNQAWR